MSTFPRLLARLWLCASCAFLCACQAEPQKPRRAGVRPAPRPAAPADWAAQVGGEPSPSPARREVRRQARVVVPATLADHAYAQGGTTVPVRRLVYRVGFIVPPALRARRAPLPPPAGELHVDVAQERLRARFVGQGWPLDDGSEVRLRADVPGVYLYDGEGGRPLGPGQLAGWFQGHEHGHAKAGVRVRRDATAKGDGPGELMCALLAEWTAQPRDEIVPRCAGGSLPPAFRLGLWSAELTAIVPLSLSRRELRADSADPPAPPALAESHALLEAADVARLPALRVRGDFRAPLPALPDGEAVLEVENHTDARAIVVVQGVPVGFLRARARARFPGFRAGYYRVGAVRPFGQPVITPTLLRIPGVLRLGRAPDAPLGQASPLPAEDSPTAAR